MSEPGAAYRYGLDVCAVSRGEDLYLAQLPAGPIHVLSGSAAVIVETATSVAMEVVIGTVADACGLPPHDVADDVIVFLQQLEELHLLERGD